MGRVAGGIRCTCKRTYGPDGDNWSGSRHSLKEPCGRLWHSLAGTPPNFLIQGLHGEQNISQVFPYSSSAIYTVLRRSLQAC